jgi:hypothetical protein
VLSAGGDSGTLQRLDHNAPESRHVLRFFAKRAIADHRVLRVRVNVEHRRVIQIDADRFELGGECRGEPPCEFLVTGAPERVHRGPDGERVPQSSDAPPLLVHADPQRQLVPQLARRKRELEHLLGGRNVTGKQDHAAEVKLARDRPQFRGYLVAIETDDRELPDMASQISQ